MKLVLVKLNELQTDMSGLKTDVSDLKTDVKDLKVGQEEIKDHLIQLDSKNANRHLEINNNLENLARDLTTLESVAGKNLIDIALLKSVK